MELKKISDFGYCAYVENNIFYIFCALLKLQQFYRYR